MRDMNTHILQGCGASKTAPFFRGLLRSAIVLAVAVCIAMGLFVSPASAGHRSLWVVRDALVSAASIDSMVVLADSLGFDMIFVQVRGRGDAWYKGGLEPGPDKYPYIPEEFDPLAYVIRKAHERGIAVHAWMNMYLTWTAPEPPRSPLHPVNRHPSWFMVSRSGVNTGTCPLRDFAGETVEGRYLSPGSESVRVHLLRIATAIVTNYDVDGLHLDYVRYPGRDYDFHPYIRRKFALAYGRDPLDVVSAAPGEDPSLRLLERWIEFRTSLIDRQVRSIAERVREIDSNVLVSAAVKPHIDEALYQYGQNWGQWLKDGVMDFVAPMSYYEDTETFTRILDRALERVDPAKVMPGIGAYRLTPTVVRSQIEAAGSRGTMGFALFSYDTLSGDAAYATRLAEIIHDEGVKTGGE